MKPNKGGDFSSKYHKLPPGDLDSHHPTAATAAAAAAGATATAAAAAALASNSQQFVVRDTIVMVCGWAASERLDDWLC